MNLTSLQCNKISLRLLSILLVLMAILPLGKSSSESQEIHNRSRANHKITFGKWTKLHKHYKNNFHVQYLIDLRRLTSQWKSFPKAKNKEEIITNMGDQIQVIGIAVKNKPLAGLLNMKLHHEVYTLMFWPEQKLYLRTTYSFGATNDVGKFLSHGNKPEETKIWITDFRIASKRHLLNPTGNADVGCERVHFCMVEQKNIMSVTKFHDKLWPHKATDKGNTYLLNYHVLINNCWDFSGHVCRLFKVNKQDCKNLKQHIPEKEKATSIPNLCASGTNKIPGKYGLYTAHRLFKHSQNASKVEEGPWSARGGMRKTVSLS